jgi:5-formyltetrahydrofolate cyclo-ligase
MQDWKEINAWRKAERVTLIERRMRVPLAQRRSWSAVIEEHLDRLIRERAARTIGFYWPFKAEFDPRPLIRRLLDDGRHAALPVVLAPRTPMEFRRWTPDAEMDVGVYDIPFPKARDILLPDLVLAPPVGFDAARYRLGYGGGYFDRTLAALSPRASAIGVGFAMQELETIHPQHFDVPMDVIVTETGTRRR